LNKIESLPVLQDCFLDHPYALAGRVIDPVLGTLSWQGKVERLRRKELEVLALLASVEGAVVPRQAFIELIWNGNNLVGEQAVTVTISSLRQALRDSQSAHPLIRTIPRRGYQLSEPVQQPVPTIVNVAPVPDAPPIFAAESTADSQAAAPTAPPLALVPGGDIPGCPGWRLMRRLSESQTGESASSESWLAEPSEYSAEVENTAPRVFRFCRSQAYLRRLQREVTLLRYVNQSLAERPNFAVIRDWQLDEPPYYVARDYAKYGSLGEWAAAGGLAQTPPLPLMVQLSEALAALHALGVVHRNLSAKTILVDETEPRAGREKSDSGPQLKISAFGFGALADRSALAPLNITSAGLTLGVEEATEEPSAADDVLALGAVLLQLATGDLQAQPSDTALDRVADTNLQAVLRRCIGPAHLRPSAAKLAAELHALAGTSAIAIAADIPAENSAQSPANPKASATTPRLLDGAESIGNYRLLDKLGEGGMGTVYLAEQRDPYRKVALKIIRTGLDGKQILSRFDAERQALAMMNHPNVASVHDSGLAADGRPFFAMEYIQGDDINTYCDAHHLSLPARIKLFLQVCDGMLHAHQKGVLHRDIKPSNLMVSSASDSAGSVKVIDFGLAKSLHGKLAAQTLHTSFGAFIGTPVYSSPEHVSGAASGVDTRSDIYSMGVVLYELLAGMTPIASESLENLEPQKVRELVCKSKLPSMREQLQNTSEEKRKELAEHRAIDVEELPKTLEGDLSWVVGKCLERDPNDRYASVLELKKDLERWLELRPVEARPTTGWYRFRKLVRRHRGASMLIAASVAMILLTTTAAILGYLRAERALEASRVAEVEASAAADFQVKQMQAVDPGAMGLTLREQLIDAVQKRSTERGWEPAAITQGQQQLSTLIEGVNFTDLSLGQLDKHQFQPTLASITKDFKDQPLLQARLWQSLADSLMKLGRIDAAMEPQQLALAQRKRLLGEDDPLTLVSLRTRGTLRVRNGQFEEAEADFRAAITGMQRVLGYQHLETLQSQSKLVEVFYEQGRYDEALKPAQDALDAARQTLAADHAVTLRLITLMGFISLGRKDFPEAEKFLRDALEGYRRVHGSQHPQTWNPMNNLAALFSSTGRYAEAETMLLQVLDAKRAGLGDNHGSTLATQTNLASVVGLQGRLAESEELSRQLLQAMERTLGEEHPDTLAVAHNLVFLLREQGKREEAVALARQNLSIVRREKGGSDHRLNLFKLSLAGALLVNEKFDEANTVLRDVLQAQRLTLGDLHRDTLATITYLASALEGEKNLGGAETLLREALAGQRKTLGDNDQDTVATIDQLAQILRARGKLAEALALGQESIDVASGLGDVGKRHLSLHQIHHAGTLLDLRRFDDAERLLDKAKTALTQDHYPERTTVEGLAEGYIELYTQRHKTQPALGFDAKAKPWERKLVLLKSDVARVAADILREK
jgi:eukaryotic-like serine/threonine-protein kinase